MKTTMMIGAPAALAPSVGCPKQDSKNEPPTPPVSTNQVMPTVHTAPAAAFNQLAQAKELAVATVEKQLQALDAKVAQLAAKSAGHVGDAKTEARTALATLRKKRGIAAGNFRELKSASQDTWQNVKAGFDLVFQELEKACDELKSKFPG